MSEAKDWAGELISGQTGTGRILVSSLYLDILTTNGRILVGSLYLDILVTTGRILVGSFCMYWQAPAGSW